MGLRGFTIEVSTHPFYKLTNRYGVWVSLHQISFSICVLQLDPVVIYMCLGLLFRVYALPDYIISFYTGVVVNFSQALLLFLWGILNFKKFASHSRIFQVRFSFVFFWILQVLPCGLLFILNYLSEHLLVLGSQLVVGESIFNGFLNRADLPDFTLNSHAPLPKFNSSLALENLGNYLLHFPDSPFIWCGCLFDKARKTAGRMLRWQSSLWHRWQRYYMLYWDVSVMQGVIRNEGTVLDYVLF